MSFASKEVISITTAADGTATAYSAVITGKLNAIVYTKDDFTDGVDFTITTEDTTQNLWVESNVNASKVVAPRQATHDTVGVASLYAVGGEPVEGKICVVDERIKIVIAQGGATKKGKFTVILE